MDFGLRGKVGIVAASSKGIGKAIATGFAAEGMSVAVNGRESAAIAATAAEIRQQTGASVIEVTADVSTREGAEDLIARTVAEFGALHVIVPNAGGPRGGGFFDLTDEDFEATFRTNFLSTVRMIRAAVPHMKAAGWGRIINLQSTAIKQPVPLITLTNSIRPGIVGLSKDLADELGTHNITVNTILSGPILTDRLRYTMQIRAATWGVSEDEVLANALKQVPMGRWGKPEDLACLAVFLASEQAGWITGTAIQVDGGRMRSPL